MPAFKSPNHTQTPNDFFDVMMKGMGEAELKVTLCAIRQTLGWHRKKAEMSLTFIMEMTGLSKQGAIDGVEQAILSGTIKEAGKGARGVNVYELVITDDQSNELTSQASRPVKPVDQYRSNELTSTSQASRPIKEKENKENKDTCDPSPLASGLSSPLPEQPAFNVAVQTFTGDDEEPVKTKASALELKLLSLYPSPKPLKKEHRKAIQPLIGLYDTDENFKAKIDGVVKSYNYIPKRDDLIASVLNTYSIWNNNKPIKDETPEIGGYRSPFDLFDLSGN